MSDDLGSAALHYQINIYPWIDLILSSFLPFILLLTSNLAIAIKLALIKKKKKMAMQSQAAGEKSEGVNLTSLTAMLLSICTIFLIFTLPLAVFMVGYDNWFLAARARGDLYAIARLNLQFAVCVTLWSLNFSVNFFAYVLTGPRFRKELLAMCRCPGSRIGLASSS